MSSDAVTSLQAFIRILLKDVKKKHDARMRGWAFLFDDVLVRRFVYHIQHTSVSHVQSWRFPLACGVPCHSCWTCHTSSRTYKKREERQRKRERSRARVRLYSMRAGLRAPVTRASRERIAGQWDYMGVGCMCLLATRGGAITLSNEPSCGFCFCLYMHTQQSCGHGEFIINIVVDFFEGL